MTVCVVFKRITVWDLDGRDLKKKEGSVFIVDKIIVCGV